jgi:hypothetical protein
MIGLPVRFSMTSTTFTAAPAVTVWLVTSS